MFMVADIAVSEFPSGRTEISMLYRHQVPNHKDRGRTSPTIRCLHVLKKQSK